jgi:hypothetical protein
VEEESSEANGVRGVMKRLRRCCWLAAWCVWVWLGFRLHHELPRNLGPMICQIPLEKGWWVEGFLDEQLQIVVHDNHNPSRHAVFDAKTGACIRDFESRPGMNLHAHSRWLRRLRRGQTCCDDYWVSPRQIPWEWKTVSIRDVYGRVVEREWTMHWNEHESDDGAFVANNRGEVYRRASVHWPPLALCQTILALPLVMLWAVLRWRRKRWMRLASVEP